MDYNSFIADAFRNFGHDVIHEPACLSVPYDGQWRLVLPRVDWQDHALVVLHAQDFLTVDHSGCPELNAIEQHFKSHASRVVVVHWNRDIDRVYSGPVQLIYFPSHSYDFLQKLRQRSAEWQNTIHVKRAQHQWQCLNGIIKPHRQRVISMLPPGGMISLGSDIALREHAYDHYAYDNVQNWLDLLPVYRQCSVNIVTETIYDFSPGIISEKTLQAWLACQVPIIVGHRGIIQQCRDMGFDTFDDVLDNSYDLLDNTIRAEEAIRRNLSVISQGINGLESRLLRNQQRACVTWPDLLVSGYFLQVIDIHKRLSKP